MEVTMKLNKISRKRSEGLSHSLRAAALYFAAAAIPFAANAEIITNYWQGADGAAWGTPGNWSQNHVPTIDELKKKAKRLLLMCMEHQDREFWWAGGMHHGGICATYDDKWGLSLIYIEGVSRVMINKEP